MPSASPVSLRAEGGRSVRERCRHEVVYYHECRLTVCQRVSWRCRTCGLWENMFWAQILNPQTGLWTEWFSKPSISLYLDSMFLAYSSTRFQVCLFVFYRG